MKEIISNAYGNNDSVPSKKSKTFTIVNPSIVNTKPETYQNHPEE